MKVTEKVRDIIPWIRRQTPAQREETHPLRALQWDIDRAFEDFWRTLELPMLGTPDSGSAAAKLLNIDVRESEKEVEVVAELPGVDESNLEVKLADGTLSIRGEKKVERETQEKGYLLRERSFGRVERVVPLPEGLDLDAAKATFKNGVLTVKLPKTAQAQNAVKRIEVKRG